MKEITDFAEEAATIARAHGFHVPPDSLDRALLLIVSEVTEAQAELRAGYAPNYHYYREDGKPEGFGAELADVIIRTLQLAVSLGIDIEGVMREKQAFNRTRPYKHGKEF